MSRRRLPENLRLTLRRLFRLAAVVGAASLVSAACATEQTSQSPDAGVPRCQVGPHIFCEPVGADVAGCSTDDGTSPLLNSLPRATRYPVNCVVNYVGERDPQGDCRNNGVCKCQIPDSAEIPADDAGEAGAPVTSGAPVWNCTL